LPARRLKIRRNTQKALSKAIFDAHLRGDREKSLFRASLAFAKVFKLNGLFCYMFPCPADGRPSHKADISTP